MKRRGFMSAILAAGMAPAVVKSGVIMQINPRQGIWTRDFEKQILFGERYSSNREIVQAMFADAAVHREIGEALALNLQLHMKRPSFMGAWRKVHGSEVLVHG